MIKNIKNKLSGSSGFSLVETLVAISLFTIGVLVMLAVLAKGISDITYTKKKNTAEYLAQEGIEYVRNMRDTYVLFSSSPAAGWSDFKLKTIPRCASACYLNADSLFTLPQPMPLTKVTVTSCGSSCPNILYSASTGRYGYTTGNASGFIRDIRVVQSDTAGDEVKVFSTVYWQQGSGVYNLTFSENLFNWVE